MQHNEENYSEERKFFGSCWVEKGDFKANLPGVWASTPYHKATPGVAERAWSSNVFPTTLFNRNLTRGRYGCFLVNFYNMAVFFLLFPFILHSFCYYILKNILFSQCCFSCLTLLLAFFIVMFFLTNPPCEDPPKSLSLLWPKSKFNSSPCSCSPTDPSLHSQVLC